MLMFVIFTCGHWMDYVVVQQTCIGSLTAFILSILALESCILEYIKQPTLHAYCRREVKEPENESHNQKKHHDIWVATPMQQPLNATINVVFIMPAEQPGAFNGAFLAIQLMFN